MALNNCGFGFGGGGTNLFVNNCGLNNTGGNFSGVTDALVKTIADESSINYWKNYSK